MPQPTSSPWHKSGIKPHALTRKPLIFLAFHPNRIMLQCHFYFYYTTFPSPTTSIFGTTKKTTAFTMVSTFYDYITFIGSNTYYFLFPKILDIKLILYSTSSGYKPIANCSSNANRFFRISHLYY